MKELFVSTSAREIDEEVLRSYRITAKDIDLEIVQTCFTMLQFKDFDSYNVENSLISRKNLYLDSFKGQDPLVEQVKRYPLLSYAIRRWLFFDDATHESYIAKVLQSFFQSFQGEYFRLAAAQGTYDLLIAVPGASALWPLELPALHHCVQTGDFPETVVAVMASGANANELDIDGMSPLHWACARSRKATI